MRLDLDLKKAIGTMAVAAAVVLSGGTAAAQEEVDTYEQTPPPQVIDDNEARGDAPDGGAPTHDDVEPAPEVLGDQVVAGADETAANGGPPAVGADEAAANGGPPGVGADGTAADGGGLPVTGGDIVGLVAIGGAAVAAGAATLLYRRRLD